MIKFYIIKADKNLFTIGYLNVFHFKLERVDKKIKKIFEIIIHGG